MSRPPKKIKLLRDGWPPGMMADGTINIGTPREMYPRVLLWKSQQEALERGEDPTLITLEVIRQEVATNPATKLATEAWVKKVTGKIGSASGASADVTHINIFFLPYDKAAQVVFDNVCFSDSPWPRNHYGVIR